MTAWYLDSSATVKFAVAEPESEALQAWREQLATDDVLMTCELAVAEVLRAVRRVDGDATVALAHLDALEQLPMNRDLMLAAGGVPPGWDSDPSTPSTWPPSKPSVTTSPAWSPSTTA